MTERKKRDKSLYDNTYDFRTDWLWADINDIDDIGYSTIINYFCKRSGHQPEVSGKVMQIPEESFNKPYDVTTVIRMMTDVMFTKKLTKLKSGKKKRVTMTKKFIDMEKWDTYTWGSLIEEVRYCVLNEEDTMLLSYKELQLLK